MGVSPLNIFVLKNQAMTNAATVPTIYMQSMMPAFPMAEVSIRDTTATLIPARCRASSNGIATPRFLTRGLKPSTMLAIRPETEPK